MCAHRDASCRRTTGARRSIELLVAVVILGIAVVALVGGARHRHQDLRHPPQAGHAGAYVRAFAEALETVASRPPRPATARAPVGADLQRPVHDHRTDAATTTAEVVSRRVLERARRSSTACPASDTGVQRVTLRCQQRRPGRRDARRRHPQAVPDWWTTPCSLTTRDGDDRGVTLIEVLIAIVLLGVIIVPLADARDRLLPEHRRHHRPAGRVARRPDRRGLLRPGRAERRRPRLDPAPYPLAPSVETDVAALTGGRYPCGPADRPRCCVRLAWDDPTPRPATPQRTCGCPMWCRSSAPSGSCTGCARTCVGATPTSDIVLAHNLDTTRLPRSPAPPRPAPRGSPPLRSRRR